MKSREVWWHVYRKVQIRPELRGRLSYVLDIPRTPGSPVIRHIFDPSGKDFPRCTIVRVRKLLETPHHGIVYLGVSKEAVYDVILSDPAIHRRDSDFILYNRDLVCNARKFFLCRPEQGFHAVPEQTLRLLCGYLGILERDQPALQG